MSFIYNPAAYENATRQYILANARKTFRKNFPRAEEVENFLYAEAYKAKPFPLWVSFYEALYEKYGKLTEKQVACVLNSIDKKEAKKAEWAAKQASENAKSGFVGNVGDKVQLKLTVEAVIEIEGPSFSYYDSGISWINILKDEAGNVYKYKGKTFLGEKGEVVIIKASIKEQVEYKGTKQNVIQRPKLVETINQEKEVA